MLARSNGWRDSQNWAISPYQRMVNGQIEKEATFDLERFTTQEKRFGNKSLTFYSKQLRNSLDEKKKYI